MLKLDGSFGIKRLAFYALVVFYVFAGINHFINPAFYWPLIPPYLGDKVVINTLAGIAEILLGFALLVAPVRKWAAIGIVAMLLAFIPSHVYFIEIDGCVEEGLCVPMWIAWARLIVIHPILMLWAWYYRKPRG